MVVFSDSISTKEYTETLIMISKEFNPGCTMQ